MACLTAGLALGGCKSGGAGPTDGGGGSSANCPSNPDDLISDFEGGDNSLAPKGGRQGGWYTYGDSLGMFDRPNGYNIDEGNPNCTASGSLHIKGTGFAMWGAATGVDWKPRASNGDGDGGLEPKMTYDASMYRGVSFWAKANKSLNGVQVSFPDLYTDKDAPLHDMPEPTDATMFMCRDCTCMYASGFPNNCSPYLVQFGRKGDAAADVVFSGYAGHQMDTTWKRFEVLFVDTKQDPGNGGYHTPDNRLDVAHLTAMAIQINAEYPNGAPVANDFEIWLDDVAFIR